MTDTTTLTPTVGAQTVDQKRLLLTAIPGPESLARQARREAAVPQGVGTVLPVFVDRMSGGIVVDVDGNQLIDLASGIAVTSVGATHPSVVGRVHDQVDRFSHTCFLVTEYDGFIEVADTLNRLTPGTHAKKTMLFSTGAEAVENAVKIARSATKRPAVITFGHAYHGRTLMTMTMTAKNAPYKDGFGPFAPEVYRAPLAYPYRWGTSPERCAQEALADLNDLVLKQIGAHNVAAIVIEPIQGEGGFIVPPPGYLAGVQAIANAHGIVFVADEVQTGIGRTGAMFASEHAGIVPDLVVTAKALGGGLPLSAVTGRAELMDAVHPGGLGGTYSGNPIACAAALGVFEAIEHDHLLERAREIGDLITRRLRAIADECPWIGEVRGIGAMQAVEFIVPGSLEPSPEATAAVAAFCHRSGVLALTCGTYGNVVRMLPPLVITDDLLDDALSVFADACRSLS